MHIPFLTWFVRSLCAIDLVTVPRCLSRVTPSNRGIVIWSLDHLLMYSRIHIQRQARTAAHLRGAQSLRRLPELSHDVAT